MGDIAGYAALITAIGGLVLAVIDNRRLRTEHKDKSATALRIQEIKDIKEFRAELRATNKEQRETIQTLGEELEKNRLERIAFEEERLGWFDERRALRARVTHLEEMEKRVEALERSLGEARGREQELAATLQKERESWAIQRRGLELRIHSLERALQAAGVDVPLERGATG